MPLLKRTMDVIGAGAGLVLLSPGFFLIALLIKLDDGGPVFFGHWRIGRGGVPFRMWKFRSMLPGAERIGPQITAGGDPRITRVGRYLRAHKLDELPQLLNVLTGEMSLVGPRPEVHDVVARYSPAQRRILEFTPGITDPGSLSSLGEAEALAQAADPETEYLEAHMPYKVQLSLQYCDAASFVGDLRLVIQTLRHLLLGTRPPLQLP